MYFAGPIEIQPIWYVAAIGLMLGAIILAILITRAAIQGSKKQGKPSNWIMIVLLILIIVWLGLLLKNHSL
jgi:hypothetical protein